MTLSVVEHSMTGSLCNRTFLLVIWKRPLRLNLHYRYFFCSINMNFKEVPFSGFEPTQLHYSGQNTDMPNIKQFEHMLIVSNESNKQ
jgi:hypothetical protein